jgi:hypothetical protein
MIGDCGLIDDWPLDPQSPNQSTINPQSIRNQSAILNPQSAMSSL